MSVSEKLKALRPDQRRDELEDALPQIVAVVEAAEAVSGEHVLSNYSQFRDLGDAISALEEALTEKEFVAEARRRAEEDVQQHGDFWRPTGECPPC